MNDIADLDDRNNAIVAVLAQYRAQRLALNEKWVGEGGEGDRGAVKVMTDAVYKKFKPETEMLDEIVKGLLSMTSEVAAETYDALFRVQQARADYFDTSPELTLLNLEGNEVAVKFRRKVDPKKRV